MDSTRQRQNVYKVAPVTPKSSEGDVHSEGISTAKIDLGRDPSPKVTSRPSSSRQSSPGSPTPPSRSPLLSPKSPGGLWASLKTSLAGTRSSKLPGPNRGPQKSPKSSPPTLRSLTTKLAPPPISHNSTTKTKAQFGARSSSNPQYGASAPSVRPRSLPSLQTE